jgi:hypothetical protein
MHLTGSEINHPNKAGATLYDAAKTTETLEDFERNIASIQSYTTEKLNVN